MSLGLVEATTHGPEYSWHKYWSRKPANLISAYLSEMLQPGDLVIDPFCGSGVTLRESQRLGINSIGLDVNPIAIAISTFLTQKVCPDEFNDKANSMLHKVREKYLKDYLTKEGHEIRYLVHKIVTRCAKCKMTSEYNVKSGKTSSKKCPNCQSKLSFALNSMVETIIDEIVLIDPAKRANSEELLRQNGINSDSTIELKTFDLTLVNNARTLTNSRFPVSSYFTPRNFNILSEFAKLAHEEEVPDLRNALLLLITSSSAQSSRLIASRGSLKGGGQAWTIPGFWVPPVHLESNPFIHFEARIAKFNRALKLKNSQKALPSKTEVRHESAQFGLRSLKEQGIRADLVFLDPPYGDSVAFLEFSAIWNAFLKRTVKYGDDLSISNRIEDPMGYDDYEREMRVVFREVSEILAPEGSVLLTFNNNNLRSWRLVVSAAQANSLYVTSVNYHDPAVTSSKAQKSISGSYIGDFYVTFKKREASISSIDSNLDELKSYLHNVSSIRGLEVPFGVLLRFGLQFWLERNIDGNQIERLKDLIEENFIKVGQFYRPKIPVKEISMIELISRYIQLNPSFYSFSDAEKIGQIALHLKAFGQPSAKEIRALLKMLDSQEKGSNQFEMSFDLN